MVKAPDRIDYSRLAETVFSRDNVRTLSALVVGAGALGSEVVKTLGLVGLGSVRIADPDIVERSNLTRSVLLRVEESTGTPKATALAGAAQRLFPDTEFVPLSLAIADAGLRHASESAILFSCVDSDLARLEIAYISNKLQVPVADAGLGGANYSEGRVSYFPGIDGACYACLMTERRRRELLGFWDARSSPCSGAFDKSSGRVFPSTPTMAAIVAAMQVEIGLRRLTAQRRGAPVAALMVAVALDPQTRLEEIGLHRSPSCPLHEHGGVLTPAPSAQTAVRDFLDGDSVLELDWPICARARCLQCAFRWMPMLRLARFRREGACPRCGSGRLLGQQVIRTIDRKSEWAEYTLAALGLPDHHLLTIHSGEELVA
jgi:adenylyltransferase/sulfurtransferase